jgi:ribose transport system ATP-binding protein
MQAVTEVQLKREQEQAAAPPLLLEMRGIYKAFPGVQALQNVDFDLRPGEVHVLLGENGAGKSTLMKILSGVYQKDAGQMIFKGREVDFQNPKEAQECGISTIYQEFALVPYLSVTENIFLGDEIMRSPVPVLNWPAMHRRARETLARLHLDIDPRILVRDLGVAKQQLVEVAKALHHEADLIIMDEPTAALSQHEIEDLFEVIRQLKAHGVGVIYISHHLDEVHRIGDRVTVLRDGLRVDTLPVHETTVDQLIRMMVGRTLSEQFPKVNLVRGKEMLRVEGLTRRGVLENISFSLYAGEILGVAGLVGSGRTELARAIFGADPIDAGQLYLDGKPVTVRAPCDAVDLGIGLLTEDRKQQGLVLKMSVGNNVTMSILNRIRRSMLLNLRREEEIAQEFANKINIRTPSLNQLVMYLSGGNQQKVVLSKWLATEPKVLIFDEPTRGIDVGAKVEIYNLMNRLAEQGVAIMMISSELPEIIGMSDRVLVMWQGRLTGILNRDELTQEAIMKLATGGGNGNGGNN